ncbi:hypothetical protein [Dyadobacter sp. CY343]|jgi:ABC-type oligopeptide transport system substrate-binding subunit|uniref:hypothetical protein n=1 Tax=Dyadobacter sp. CY343 TaxID=2907299 RepID=UPI001F1C2B21|nr:hypothetical protein [Dyadobacter sp. CY343]MCE7062157.1 hypothetical protein [Dyadobacter sp. CY343]
MKTLVKVVSMVSLSMLLSLAACTSKTNEEGAGMDSTEMDNTESGMGVDTMATDTTSRPL